MCAKILPHKPMRSVQVQKVGVIKRLLCWHTLNDVFYVLLGFCIGYCVVFFIFMTNFIAMYQKCVPNRTTIQLYNFQIPQDKRFLLIAVMTTRDYLETRAVDIQETWGRRVPGDIVYFVGGAEAYTGDLPVIALTHLNDTVYPPRLKSFTTIEYMSTQLSDHYEWFIRADDDMYVKMDKLERFLRTVDSKKMLYIGQPGYGVLKERHLLGLEAAFCMGGPGVIFTRSALVKLGDHLIPDCLPKAVSKHEDTELGRCVYKFLGLSCTTANEMMFLFVSDNNKKYVNHKIPLGDKEKSAITLHPIKVHPHMQRLDILFMDSKLQDLQKKEYEMDNEVSELDGTLRQKLGIAFNLSESTMTSQLNSGDDAITTSQLNGVPRSKPLLRSTHRTSKSWSQTVSAIRQKQQRTVKRKMAKNRASTSTATIASHPRLRTSLQEEYLSKYIDKEDYVHTEWDFIAQNHRLYSRHNPYDSPDVYMSTSSKFMSKVASEIAMKYGFRKKFHLLPLAYLRLKSGKHMETILIGRSDRKFYTSKTIQRYKNIRFREMKQVPKSEIWIILPLFSRSENYQRFLTSLVQALKNFNQKVNLAVVLYRDKGKQYLESLRITKDFANSVGSLNIKMILMNETFTRGKALTKGVESLSNDTLLVFLDVDMVFDEEFLHRCQQNAIYGKQVYFPICFSQYHQYTSCYNKSECPPGTFQFGNDIGFWRDFGFGQVAMYKKDFLEAGGFDLNIKGWGKEDGDLYNKFVFKFWKKVFRAPDSSLLHRYHEKHCNVDSLKSKYKECLNSKLIMYGNSETLFKIIMDSKLVST